MGKLKELIEWGRANAALFYRPMKGLQVLWTILEAFLEIYSEMHASMNIAVFKSFM